MPRFHMAAVLYCAAIPLMTAANPFPNGDPKIGQTLVNQQKCAACHARLTGGDGTELYLRGNRRVTSPDKLRAQIAYCNSQLKSGFFPEDEEHVAAFLNREYYKFK